jgi:hypothetical protein
MRARRARSTLLDGEVGTEAERARSRAGVAAREAKGNLGTKMAASVRKVAVWMKGTAAAGSDVDGRVVNGKVAGDASFGTKNIGLNGKAAKGALGQAPFRDGDIVVRFR